MKKLLFTIFSICTLSANGQGLYDTQNITDIQITFAESNWDQILDTYYANNLNERLLATVVVNGISFDSCGVQFKGNSTYAANNAKNPLNIELDYTINQDYQGWKTLKLASGKNDPSAIREVLSYEILRNYMDAPQSNFAKVTINGTFYGVFSSSESIDADFQNKYLYAGNNNTRIKCNPVNVQNGGSSLSYNGTDSASYYNFYELKSTYGWADLIATCNAITNTPATVETILDIDRAIWMVAYNNVLVNLDSYTGPFKQNFYMITDDNNRMVPVIWDLNMNFGAFSMIASGPGGPAGGVSSLQTMDPYLRINDASWPLLKMILANPRYKKMYIAHCKTILEEQILSGSYASRGQELQNLIASTVQQDAGSAYSYANFIANLNTTVNAGGGGMSNFCGITELMETRKTYLNTHAAFTAAAPTISNLTYPTTAQANVAFNITATITNTNYAYIGYRSNPGDIFQKVQLFDDGAHGDNAAGDGIFGIQFLNGINSETQFYVYAENDNAGIFLPQRAEHEFNKINVTNDLVLNELMPSNTVTEMDQDGEYDDWIEIYNNGNTTINLDGFHLSDDITNPLKWTITGTTIAPGQYLIVWADADTLQFGLHANFKLSSSGETVLLTNPAGVILDQITYPILASEHTYGRYLNGVGGFIEMLPTYSAINSNNLSGIAEITGKSASYNLYPNPVNSILTISSDHEIQTIRIFDFTGKIVLETENPTQQLDLTNFNAGIYLVEINKDEKFKIIKN